MDFHFRAINDLPRAHWDETKFSSIEQLHMHIWVITNHSNSLFVLWFYVPVNNYGHVEMVNQYF